MAGTLSSARTIGRPDGCVNDDRHDDVRFASGPNRLAGESAWSVAFPDSRPTHTFSVNLANCERIGTPGRACVSDPLPLRGRPPLQGGHYTLPLAKGESRRRRQGVAHTRWYTKSHS